MRKHWAILFWAKVIKTDFCWKWVGWVDKNGYGTFGHRHPWSISFRDTKENYVHRISWVIHYGAIPDGKWVLHECDNPPCIRPDHLYLGDNIDNSRDRDLGGRHRGAIGESCKHTPLKNTDVILIRKLWNTGAYSQYDLANSFGVNQSSISEIVNNKSWKHLL